MTRFKAVRLTKADIVRDAKLSPEYVKAIMANYEPLGTSEEGEPLYSLAQMAAAIFRGPQQ